MRKRLLIVEEARKLGLKILNPPRLMEEVEEVEVVRPEIEESSQGVEEIKPEEETV